MTTYIRCTGYLLAGEPLTVIAALDDLSVESADEYKQHMVSRVPLAYIAVDSFECDGNLEAATVVARDRMVDAHAEAEEAEAFGLHAWITSVLPSATQCVSVPVAPGLSIERLTDVLEQVSHHPDYASQLIQCYVQDDKTLTEVAMKDGVVTTEERMSR